MAKNMRRVKRGRAHEQKNRTHVWDKQDWYTWDSTMSSRHTIQSFPQRSRVFPVACEVDRCRATVDSQMRLDAVYVHAVGGRGTGAMCDVTSLTLLHLVTAILPRYRR